MKKWNGIVGKYLFRQVAYRVLYCSDIYTATSKDKWKPNPKFHPAGIADIQEEYPSQTLSKRELLAYLMYCSKSIRNSLNLETESSLKRSASFSWIKLISAELLLYSIRHIQHHTGQPRAYLRRVQVNTICVKSGRALRLRK